jgi:hypothetical protein
MAAFDKGHEKLGGRKKGTGNKATVELKELLNRMVPEKELEALWRKKLGHKDPAIAMKAFELMLHYRFGRPVQPVAGGDEEEAPIKIDISAIPKFRVKANE